MARLTSSIWSLLLEHMTLFIIPFCHVQIPHVFSSFDSFLIVKEKWIELGAIEGESKNSNTNFWDQEGSENGN